jgi:hydroxymethylbilane synthase
MTHQARPLRLGTRGSPLALAQAVLVRDAITAKHPHVTVEIIPIVATGDRIQDRPLAEIGGKALWTKELEAALVDGDIDFAVHSMKDVETLRPWGQKIVAMLTRADVRDRLIGADSIAALPQGALVGTSAPRRTAQLMRRRPDLKIVPIRGNVQTRLDKVAGGEVQATLLAAAGLDRLGMASTGSAIEIEDMLPAPAQGAIGIETLTRSHDIISLLDDIDDRWTRHAVWAERLFLATLKGTCKSPVAAFAQIEDGYIDLRAEILSEDGAHIQSGASYFKMGDVDAPVSLAQTMLATAHPSIQKLFG